MEHRTALVLSAFLLLNACGQKEDTPPPKLFEDQRNALDKAKDVNALQQEEADRQRKALEKQTQ